MDQVRSFPRLRPLGAGVLTLALAGCAGAQATTQTPAEQKRAISPRDATIAMTRLYQLGESYYERGDYATALAMWRQTFLMIPSDQRGDTLRHALVARMGHTVLLLHAEKGNDADLRWGIQMVERWASKHEALFADRKNAKEQRGDLYELIGEMELRLEKADEAPTPRPVAAANLDAAFTDLERAASSSPRIDQLDGDVKRKVDVDTRFAQMDNPRVQRFLRHPGLLGPSILEGGDEPYNPTRPLVRYGALSSDAEESEERREARKVARSLVREIRPELERCYAEAFGRSGELVARMNVALQLNEQGRVEDMRIEKGSLVDPVGDACVSWAIMRGSAETEVQLASASEVNVPITFFIQPENRIDGSYVSPLNWGSPFLNSGGANPGDAIQHYDSVRPASPGADSAGNPRPQRNPEY